MNIISGIKKIINFRIRHNLKIFVFILKVSFAVLLLYTLFNYRQISFGDFYLLLNHLWLVAIVLVCLLLGILLGGVRWWILLDGVGVKKNLLTVLKFQLIGSFFSTYLPGAVGGDVVKWLYLSKITFESKSKIFLSIVTDRIFALFGLVITGALFILLYKSSSSNEILTYYTTLTEWLVTIMVVVPLLMFFLIPFLFAFVFKENKYRKHYIFIVNAYKGNFWQLLICSILSLLATLIVAIGIIIIARIFPFNVNDMVIGLASVFGNISSIIPLTPGGIGIGEAVFSKICSGLSGVIMPYATIYFVFRLGMLVVNIPGVVCYLFFKK